MSDDELAPVPAPPHRPGAPAHRRGAPLGNTNALKHGFYARVFRPAEQDDLTGIDPISLDHEIQLLRVFIRRTAQQAAQATALPDGLTLLSVLSRASLSLGSLLRTQRIARTAYFHDELKKIITDYNFHYDRARALIAELEAIRDAAQQESADETDEDAQEDQGLPQEEEDLANCDPPLTCYSCSLASRCEGAPAFLNRRDPPSPAP
jgi:hypothetical protein